MAYVVVMRETREAFGPLEDMAQAERFQEFMVDMYCQTENQRVGWFRSNQAKIRAYQYVNVVEAAAPGEHCNTYRLIYPSNMCLPLPYNMSISPDSPPLPCNSLYAVTGAVGTDIGVPRVILPATFTGGPRFMTGQYADAMATVRKLGKPDLFITFT